MNRETIEKAIDARLDEPDNQWDGIFNSGYCRGFKDGAHWRINSVWHDIDKDLPDCGRHVVNEDWFDFEVNSVLELKRILEKYPFKRWAYVDDLMPDTGKEAIQ